MKVLDAAETGLKFIVGVVAVILFAATSVRTIDQGEAGVVTRFGAVDRVMTPGINLKIPFVETVYYYNTRAQKFQGLEYSVASKDSLRVKARIAFVWRYNPAKLKEAYGEYGVQNNFTHNVLNQITEQFVKETTGTFEFVNLLKEREKAADLLLQKFRAVQEDYYVVFDSVAIEDLTPPQSYRDSVLAANKAIQDVKQQESRLQQQKLKSRELVQTAEAKAEAIRIEAEAKADANQKIAESLTPLLVRQNEIDRWDGKVPTTLVGEQGNVGLFLQQPATK